MKSVSDGNGSDGGVVVGDGGGGGVGGVDTVGTVDTVDTVDMVYTEGPFAMSSCLVDDKIDFLCKSFCTLIAKEVHLVQMFDDD